MVTDRAFRSLMGGVCAPVTIVTTLDGDEPAGTTVSSFASLSLRPPLVSVAFDRGSRVLSRIRSTGRFGVNILSHGQGDTALLFASRDADRFGAVRWHADHGLPRLAEVAGWAVCELHDTVDAGDHVLLVGLVTYASRGDLPPLVYADRTFGTHSRFALRPRRSITDQIAAFSR